MRRWLYGGAALLLAVSLLSLRWATARVAHFAVELDGGAPAVVYEPGAQRFFGAPPKRDDPLPVLVLTHGFSGNKGMMSTLARGLAQAGYAVVTPDFRGHGQNPNAFGFGTRTLADDLDAALLWASTQPHYDASRIAIAGHSMGGFVALDYASRNAGVPAVVAISSGAVPDGPYTPSNVLLIWASRDPEGLREGAREAGAHFAGREQLVLEETYGSAARGTAVRTFEVGGTDHVTILYSGTTVRQIAAWLESTLGPGARPVPASDGRLLWGGLGVMAFLVVLAGLIEWLRPLFPPPVVTVGGAALPRLGLVAGVLVATVVLLAGVDGLGGPGPLAFLPLTAGRDLVGFCAVTGIVLAVALVGRGVIGREGLFDPWNWGIAALLLGFAYLVFGSLVQPICDLWLPAHRLPAVALSALLCAPFFASTEWLLRAPDRSGLWAPAVAKLLTVVVIALGAATGLLSFLLILGVILLVPLFLIFEIVCWRISRSGGPNPWLATLVQAGWTGWAIGAVFPFEG